MVVSPESDWEFVWLCNQHHEIVQTHPISAHWATQIRGGGRGARERGGGCCE
jgi:hypothetical protein